MRKETVESLIIKANEVARIYSDPNRQYNGNKETFSLEKVYPLSDSTALVQYLKSGGKRALLFFYYVKGGDFWNYFFPTDSHILGMSKVADFKLQMEQLNFDKNGVQDQ